MSSRALFIEVIRAKDDLPPRLREFAGVVTGLEEHQITESYIQFLDTQIRLSPRGPEWTERLKRRRAALLPFCGITLLYGRVPVPDGDFTVQIHPQTRAIAHWEQYEYDPAV